MKCAHCGEGKAKHAWTLWACADGGRKRVFRLCEKCDIELNRRVLRFFNDPAAAAKIAAYRKKRRGG